MAQQWSQERAAMGGREDQKPRKAGEYTAWHTASGAFAYTWHLPYSQRIGHFLAGSRKAFSLHAVDQCLILSILHGPQE